MAKKSYRLFGLGTNHHHQILDHIPHQQFEKALNEAQALVEFDRSRDQSEIVRLNCEEVESYLRDLSSEKEMVHSPALTRPKRLELDRRIINALTSMRLYLDHNERRLKHLYGESSAQFQSFKNMTAFEFDNHFHYRFLYQLRNYVQHGALPINHFVESSTISKDGERLYSVSAGFRPDMLLADWDKWGKHLEPEMRLMGSKVIHATGLFSDLTASVNRIQQAIEEFERPSLTPLGKSLLPVLKPAIQKGLFPALAEVEEISGSEWRPTIHDMPMRVMRELGLI